MRLSAQTRVLDDPLITAWRPVALAALATAMLFTFGCDVAEEIAIPTLYIVSGQVADPTTNPVTAISGATVTVETAPQVHPVTTDADGIFIFQGVPPGIHRLIVHKAGKRTTLTMDIEVIRNEVELGIPLFTDAQIDSILSENGATPWDRSLGIFGAFALRSTGVPLGDASIQFSPSPSGEKIQTGEGADPIVWVNAIPGRYALSVTHSGFLWENPYPLEFRPGVLTFGAPIALPNIVGFIFSNETSGSAVSGAQVGVEQGPAFPAVTSDFLGQYRMIGVDEGDYILNYGATALMSGVGWPIEVEEDTTLSYLLFHPDTLESWSLLDGGPTLDPSKGQMVVDLRMATGGQPHLNWKLHVTPELWEHRVAQSASRPAILLNIPPGVYRFVAAPDTGGAVGPLEGVRINAGAVTYTRLDL